MRMGSQLSQNSVDDPHFGSERVPKADRKKKSKLYLSGTHSGRDVRVASGRDVRVESINEDPNENQDDDEFEYRKVDQDPYADDKDRTLSNFGNRSDRVESNFGNRSEDED